MPLTGACETIFPVIVPVAVSTAMMEPADVSVAVILPVAVSIAVML
jgi:hypothetical protein